MSFNLESRTYVILAQDNLASMAWRDTDSSVNASLRLFLLLVTMSTFLCTYFDTKV